MARRPSEEAAANLIRNVSMDFSDNIQRPEHPGRLPAAQVNPGVESRADRVARIRAEIERGEYDTPERFEAAMERMLDRLDVSLS